MYIQYYSSADVELDNRKLAKIWYVWHWIKRRICIIHTTSQLPLLLEKQSFFFSLPTHIKLEGLTLMRQYSLSAKYYSSIDKYLFLLYRSRNKSHLMKFVKTYLIYVSLTHTNHINRFILRSIKREDTLLKLV